jgi:malonyl CoA-acyl carrier protein transacylase/SAM-dependent methyltransferase
LVVGEAPTSAPAEAGLERPLHLFAASARTPTALLKLAENTAAHIRQNPSHSLADICFTAGTGRAHMEHRIALTAASSEALADRLSAYAAGDFLPDVVAAKVEVTDPPEIAFLFTGQGSQHVGMGRTLYDTQPVFRRTLERCEELLAAELDVPLLELLFSHSEADSQLHQTAYTQPAVFALQYALAELWQSWGIQPTAVMGHSAGEYAAACVAGVFSLEDGLRLTAARGRLVQALPAHGAMAAVFASEERVARAIEQFSATLSVAAVNGSEDVVISGEVSAVEEVRESLAADGIDSKPLKVSQAFHSPLIESMLPAFDDVLGSIEFRAPRLALVSNVTGAEDRHGAVADPSYWRRHLRQPVRFADGIAALRQLGYRHFVEIGPHTTLLGLGSKCPGGSEAVWLPSLRRGEEEWPEILHSLSRLYAEGVDVDWDGFDREYPRRRVHLPTYPFERKRYWVDGSAVARSAAGRVDPEHRWRDVVDTVDRAADMVPIDLRPETYPSKLEHLGRLATAFMVKALQDLGVFRELGDSRSVEEVIADFGVQGTYRHLLGRWFDNLADVGILERHADRFVYTRPPDKDVDGVRADAAGALADVSFLLEYVERCGGQLVEVLTGRKNPLDTLFPGGSTETADAMYRGWAASRYFNGVARAAVESVVRTTPATASLRVLEIGAGTGGTTASVLPALPQDRTTYWFTDVSEFFFGRAERMFESYPFVRHGLLDIERSPAEQGYGAGQFDIVVASNVLHATRNLEETLANTASLLGPGGVLILLETTQHPTWFDVTTGLIEGWQQFDDEIRRDNPLVSADRWCAALLDAGFIDARAIPKPGSPAEALPNHLIVASMPADVGIREGTALLEDDALAAAGLEASQTPAAAPSELLTKLSAAPSGDRHQILVDWVRNHLMRVLRRERERLVGPHDRLFDLGMDSLMAVEFGNVLSTGLGLEQPLPTTLVFDYPTVDAIAHFLATQLDEGSGAPATAALEPETAADTTATERTAAQELEGMTDEEVEELLNRKLEGR